jgi:hypothetical protein
VALAGLLLASPSSAGRTADHTVDTYAVGPRAIAAVRAALS